MPKDRHLRKNKIAAPMRGVNILRTYVRDFLYSLLCCFILFAFVYKVTGEAVAQQPAVTMSEKEYAAQQYELGNGFFFGSYSKIDGATAVKHFKEAAKYGHSDAMFALGRMYMSGRGVPKDTGEGMNWLEKATGGDGYQNPGAAEMLAEQYDLTGRSGTENCSKAIYWYEKAARGSQNAASRLALAYNNGDCVGQNYSKAAELFLPVAEKGDALAQVILADYYFKGKGVAQSNSEAYFWARCATRFGSKPSFTFADDLDPILAQEFPPSEREKMNERLKEKHCIYPGDLPKKK